jgi:hypothetical protein
MITIWIKIARRMDGIKPLGRGIGNPRLGGWFRPASMSKFRFRSR